MGTSPDAPEMGFDVVVGDVPTVPPAWALWQRHLIRSMDEAAERALPVWLVSDPRGLC